MEVSPGTPKTYPTSYVLSMATMACAALNVTALTLSGGGLLCVRLARRWTMRNHVRRFQGAGAWLARPGPDCRTADRRGRVCVRGPIFRGGLGPGLTYGG